MRPVPTADETGKILAGITARRDWREYLRQQLETVAGAPAEEQADYLRLAAFRLGRMVVSHGAPEPQVQRLLEAGGRRHGVSADRARQAVIAGLAGGQDYQKRGLP